MQGARNRHILTLLGPQSGYNFCQSGQSVYTRATLSQSGICAPCDNILPASKRAGDLRLQHDSKLILPPPKVASLFVAACEHGLHGSCVFLQASIQRLQLGNGRIWNGIRLGSGVNMHRGQGQVRYNRHGAALHYRNGCGRTVGRKQARVG